jgi:ribosomal protein L30/L7E
MTEPRPVSADLRQSLTDLQAAALVHVAQLKGWATTPDEARDLLRALGLEATVEHLRRSNSPKVGLLDRIRSVLFGRRRL